MRTYTDLYVGKQINVDTSMYMTVKPKDTKPYLRKAEIIEIADKKYGMEMITCLVYSLYDKPVYTESYLAYKGALKMGREVFKD